LLQNHNYKHLAASASASAAGRSCYACGSDNTYVRADGRADWYRYANNNNNNKSTDLFLCAKCYHRQTNHNYRETDRIVHAKRLAFKLLGKEKRIYLKDNPRTGQCQSCGLEIGDSYLNCRGKKARVKRTQIHHIAYHADDPLNDVIEMCTSCHGKESFRLGQLTGLAKGWNRKRTK
jgi:hypothetical protein